MENLFLMFDVPPTAETLKFDEVKWRRLSSSSYENKPLQKCLALAKMMTQMDADIFMLCEVGGAESLKNFNELFLGGAYTPILTEGNSNRNIDVGFLVKRNLPFYFDLQTNKNRLINYLYPHERDSFKTNYPVTSVKAPATSHRFSRDVAELRLFKQNVDKPFFGILLTHLKSRLDPDGIDPSGFERRQAELKTLIEIYKEFEVKHPHVPVVVAGDFNGNAALAAPDEEFKPLYAETKLIDVLEIAGLSLENRATFYQVRNNSRSDGRQIDFCFLNPLAVPFLSPGSAGVHRYKDEFGMNLGVPMTLDAKMRLPSDHYPIVFELISIPV